MIKVSHALYHSATAAVMYELQALLITNVLASGSERGSLTSPPFPQRLRVQVFASYVILLLAAHSSRPTPVSSGRWYPVAFEDIPLFGVCRPACHDSSLRIMLLFLDVVVVCQVYVVFNIFYLHNIVHVDLGNPTMSINWVSGQLAILWWNLPSANSTLKPNRGRMVCTKQRLTAPSWMPTLALVGAVSSDVSRSRCTSYSILFNCLIFCHSYIFFWRCPCPFIDVINALISTAIMPSSVACLDITLFLHACPKKDIFFW